MTPAAAPLAALTGVWVGSALWVHLRGRERLSFMRQVADHSTFLAPYNAFAYLFSAVPTRPMLGAEDFPELDHLRVHWEEIRDEARALLRDGHIRKAARHDDLAFNSFYKRDWRRFYLKWYGDIMPSARSLCPRTIELLAATPSVHAAMFAVLAPHSHLVRHRDPFAGSLRFHLGLRTPNSEKCRITVDGQTYWWKDGEGVLFDETFLHRAENETDEDRFILFCDVERPLRTRAARAFNHFIGDTLMRAFRTKNVQGEEVGALSKTFAALYPIRVLGKRIKQYNRPLYFTLKYLLVAVVLYLIFFWR